MLRRMRGNGFDRVKLTWLTYGMLSCCGFVQGSLGPATSFLRVELGFGYTVASLHLSGFAAGMVLAGVGAPHLPDFVRRRGLFWGGGVGLAAGTIFVGVSGNAVESVLFALLTGVVVCCAVMAIQAALAEHYPDANARTTALTEANLGGSVGSICGAVCLSGFAATWLGWRAALLLPAILVGILFLVYRHEPLGTLGTLCAPAAARPVLRARFWRFWALLVLGVGIEWSVTFWAVSYLEDGVGMSSAAATMATAALFGAIVVGRLAGSRLTRRRPADQLLRQALTITMIGTGMLLLPPLVPSFNLLGLLVTGIGIANLFPLALSLGLDAAPEHRDWASATCTAAVGAALVVFPLLIGPLADRLSILLALRIVLFALIVAAWALALRPVVDRIRPLVAFAERPLTRPSPAAARWLASIDKPLPAAFRLALLDFDRTLTRLFHDAAQEQGLRDELIPLLEGHGVPRAVLERDQDPYAIWRNGHDWLVWHRPWTSRSFHLKTARLLTEHEVEAARLAVLFEGIEATLAWLRDQQVTLAVVSTNSTRAVRAALDRSSIASLFVAVFAREDHHHMRALKPSPFLVQQALLACRRDASEAFLVGDSPSDMIAGRRAGVYTIGVLTGTTSPEHLKAAGARSCISSLEGLQDLRVER
jgi:phosphoglycolate phosphatase-like HAD superfamily hydrolase